MDLAKLKSRKTKNLELTELFDDVINFVEESVRHLKKHADTSKIPTIRRYKLQEEGGITKIVASDQPNWWRVSSYMKPIFQLASYKAAVEACLKCDLLTQRDGMTANALNHGTTFQVARVPVEILTYCIVRENGIRFRKRTVHDAFEDLKKFVTATTKSKASLVAPIDNFRMDRKLITLGANARLRRLSPTEIVSLANRCSILGLFYGRELSPWFTTILEIDFMFTWEWQSNEDPSQGLGWEGIHREEKAHSMARNRLNDELILLRSLLNKGVCAPTYVLDYKGWESDLFSGGAVHHLPWQRPTIGFPVEVDKKESNHYSKNRSRFINLNDESAKRRIFSAMRRQSAALNENYAADKLFNAIAGLEGLLVASQSEVSHKLAERASLLIEKKVEDRCALFAQMKKAYDLRSKVAHGSVVADDLFLMLNGRKLSEKEVAEFNSVNELSRSCLGYLHFAITECITRGSVDFDWTKTLMSGKQVV